VRPWVSALCSALAAVVVAAPAGAKPTSSARAPEALSVVVIEVDGDRAAVLRTRAVATELLTRLGVASIVTSPADEPASTSKRVALARARFDLTDPTQPSIVIVEGESEREVLRRDLPESASLEVSVEELSHVLYAVVEALLRERTPEAESAGALEPAPPPAITQPDEPPRSRRKPAKRSGADFEVGAFFRVLDVGSSRIVPGGGALLQARASEGTARPGALLMGAAHDSTSLNYGLATAGVRPFSLRLYPTLTIATGTSVSLVAGLGGGMDWFRVERERTPAEALPGVTSVLDMTLSSFLGARFELSAGLGLEANASLDLDLTPHHFVVETESGRSTLLELGRLRPGATFGASYAVVDGASATSRGGNP
jgi:hypothetical protein